MSWNPVLIDFFWENEMGISLQVPGMVDGSSWGQQEYSVDYGTGLDIILSGYATALCP
jgi:hypothetical protein